MWVADHSKTEGISRPHNEPQHQTSENFGKFSKNLYSDNCPHKCIQLRHTRYLDLTLASLSTPCSNQPCKGFSQEPLMSFPTFLSYRRHKVDYVPTYLFLFVLHRYAPFQSAYPKYTVLISGCYGDIIYSSRNHRNYISFQRWNLVKLKLHFIRNVEWVAQK